MQYDYNYIPSQMHPNLKLQFTSDEGLIGIDKEMTFSTNNLGFRGDSLIIDKPTNEYRIFIIGGSTTECLYLDDSKSIDKILQSEIQKSHPNKTVKVYNAGRSGDATPEHLAMLSQRLVHLKPNMIIVFAGFNDFMRSVNKYDYLHLNPKRLYSPPYLYLAATDYQIFRRIYYLVKQTTFEDLKQNLSLSTNLKLLCKIQQQQVVSDSIPNADTSSYANNLSSIAGICKENKISLIFMTNQTTWNSQIDSTTKNWHWLLTDANKITYKEERLDSGVCLFNNTMRSIAQSKQVPLYDLASTIPKSMEYFYDDCHFNNTGALRTGVELSKFIEEKKLIPTDVE